MKLMGHKICICLTLVVIALERGPKPSLGQPLRALGLERVQVGLKDPLPLHEFRAPGI